jgi:cytochrome c oxidase subunit 4
VLLVLLGATLLVAQFDLGPLNTALAISIAFAKAALIILYFMHVRYSSRVIWVYAVTGFFWLAILIVLSMSDFLTRGWLPAPGLQ